MFFITRYLSLVIITLIVLVFGLQTAVRAELHEASVAELELDGNQRKAILDALREEIKRRDGRDVVFVVHRLNVSRGWAWLDAVALSADGNERYRDLSALLGRRGEAWEILELPCNDASIPTCVGNAGYVEGVKQRFPAVPHTLFTDSGIQAGPTTSVVGTAQAATASVADEEHIDFDRDFRGLLHEPQISAEFAPTREQLRQQLASAHSQIQSMTGTVRELKTNRQELVSRLAELDNELDSQRQATAQAHNARQALMSDLSRLRDKLTALTDAIDTVRTNQQKSDPKLADLRDQLTTQGDAVRRFDSHITAIQSELTSVHAQVSKLHAAQQKLSNEAIDSQQQINKTHATTQTQLQSIQQSLQALQSGRQDLASELSKLREELNRQGQTIAQANTARDALVAELATKKSLSEVTAAQKQFEEQQSGAREQLQSIQQSLQALQSGRQDLASELSKLREELNRQGQTVAQANTARDALVAELATKKSLSEVTIAQIQFDEEQSAVRKQLESIQRSLKGLQTSRKNLTSELNKLSQEVDGRREAETQFDAARKTIVNELATIRSKTNLTDKAIQSEQKERKKLVSEVVALQQQVAGQSKSASKSDSAIAEMRTELASIGDQLKVLSERQTPLDQTARSQERINKELSSVREQFKTQRRLFAQSELDRRKLMTELSELRVKLGALDKAEQVARTNRNQLSAEFNALRQEVAATAQQRRAQAPTPHRPQMQSGSSSAWKIKPTPENTDPQVSRLASGTMLTPPRGITSSDTTSRPKTTGSNTSGGTPTIIRAIDLPAESPQAPENQQLASVSNIKDLNALSDFEAIDPFLQAWTEDWERKDLEAYLAHYSSNFQPPQGVNLTAWRDQRRNSLLRPAFIEVDINNVEKRSTGASSVQLTFYQTYRSNIYSDQVVKTLDLRWEDERWKILREESRSVN